MSVGSENSRPEFEHRWHQRFCRFAEVRDDDAGIAGWTKSGLQARVRRFERVWPGDVSGKVWLDAGCGAGTYARLLRDHGLRVLALDYSFAALSKGCARGGGAIRWTAADVTQLPLPDASVDGVLCLGVTQALADSGRLMGELARVVKDGGQTWIDALNGWCVPHLAERAIRWIKRRPPHLRYESTRRMRRLMREAGYQEVRVYWLPVAPGRLAWLQQGVEYPVVAALFQRVPWVGALLSHSFLVYGRREREKG